MKKLLLIAALAFSSVAMNAQGLEGKWFVGGEVGFGSKNDKAADRKKTNFTILPTIGTFINPSVAIGAGLGYTNKKIKVDGIQESKTNSFVIQPFARKYWNIVGGLHFFGQAALPISFGQIQGAKIENTPITKTNTTSFGLDIAPGFDYIVNSWFSIETSFSLLNLNYTSSKPKGGKSSNDFSFTANPFDGDRDFGGLRIGAKFLF